jgi:DNA mismatch endonuclease (patch repair protein)
MAAIRSQDTKPELVLRRGLHALGFRFRLHSRHLPGRPDMVFAKYRAVIFVNGCFWHGHDCDLFRWPATREAFWRNKIGATVARDHAARTSLSEAGWRTATVWECTMKGRGRHDPATMIAAVANWLRSGEGNLELTGNSAKAEQES